MNEQDLRAIENMCLTGMELDGLCACFPSFSREEIEKIYNDVHNRPNGDQEGSTISVNCS